MQFNKETIQAIQNLHQGLSKLKKKQEEITTHEEVSYFYIATKEVIAKESEHDIGEYHYAHQSIQIDITTKKPNPKRSTSRYDSHIETKYKYTIHPINAHNINLIGQAIINHHTP